MDSAERGVQIAWTSGLSALARNPVGAEACDIGPATAVRAPNVDEPFYNRAFGIDRAATVLVSVLDWFAEISARPRIETIPHHLASEVVTELRRRGFSCSGFNSMFGAPVADLGGVDDYPDGEVPADRAAPADGISIERVDLDEFITAALRVSGSEFEQLIAPADELRAKHEGSAWHLYRGLIGAHTCAWARMRVAHGTASLCGANTAPNARGAGLQTALLRRRLVDARRLGCDLVAAQAEPGTTSQRNMERLGLHLAYHKAIWMPTTA